MAERVESDDLTTLERVKRALGMPTDVSDKDPYLISLIGAASGWVRSYTQQPIRQRAVSWSVAGEGLLEGRGGTVLQLPAWPVLAISALNLDTRFTGLDWGWDDTLHVETGTLRYGPTKDFILDQQRGRIVLGWQSWEFAEGPYVSCDAVVGLADGSTAMPLPMHSSFPFSASIFSSAAEGGSRHNVFGWNGPTGDAIRGKVDELVCWMSKQRDRASSGIASTSSGGATINYLQNVPVEITSFFDRLKRFP